MNWKVLEASARDVVLAALAAFVGAMGATAGNWGRAALVAAGWAAVRAGIGVVAAKLR